MNIYLLFKFILSYVPQRRILSDLTIFASCSSGHLTRSGSNSFSFIYCRLFPRQIPIQVYHNSVGLNVFLLPDGL